MTISEICDILKSKLYKTGFEYGFVLNGIKYKPNMEHGFDYKYQQFVEQIYVVQKPEDTLNYKIGTCIDTVILMSSLLDNLEVQYKIWLLDNKKKVHTILTFNAENRIVYLELTPQSSKPWYGNEIIYSNENELQNHYNNNGFDIIDITDKIVVGERPHFFNE